MDLGRALYEIGAILVCFSNSWYGQHLGLVRSLAIHCGSRALWLAARPHDAGRRSRHAQYTD